MLRPKNKKYKKEFRIKVKGSSSSRLEFGHYGIKVLDSGILTSKKLMNLKKILNILLKEVNGKLWFRIFPDKPVTRKSKESRMGKGKGEVSDWVAIVKKGKIILEFSGYLVHNDFLVKLYKLLVKKISFRIELVTKDVYYLE